MKPSLNYKWACSIVAFVSAALLWLISKNSTVKEFWDKPVLIAFVFFFLVVVGYAIGAWADNYMEKTGFIK